MFYLRCSVIKLVMYVSFEEYKNMMQIQYNLLKGLYFDDCIKEINYEIYMSNTITDNFWNINILGDENIFDNKNTLNEIEEHFKAINRQSCIYVPRMIEKHSNYKKYLINNGYSLNDVDSHMILSNYNINVDIQDKIKFVETKKDFDDFMDVMESAYGGDITEWIKFNGFNHFFIFSEFQP